jgi:hypothetical protein
MKRMKTESIFVTVNHPLDVLLSGKIRFYPTLIRLNPWQMPFLGSKNHAGTGITNLVNFSFVSWF